MPEYYRQIGEAIGAAMAHNATLAARRPAPALCPARLRPLLDEPTQDCTRPAGHDGPHHTWHGTEWTDQTAARTAEDGRR